MARGTGKGDSMNKLSITLTVDELNLIRAALLAHLTTGASPLNDRIQKVWGKISKRLQRVEKRVAFDSQVCIDREEA
jgi:hypothetical protein